MDVALLMSAVSDMVTKFMTTIDAVNTRLVAIEQKMAFLPTSTGATVMVPSTVTSDKPGTTTPTPTVPTWADQTKELAAADPPMKFMHTNVKPMRLRGQSKLGAESIKTVPRQIACFVGRLASDVSEKDLSDYLMNQGITDVYCRKLAPKTGMVFNTSAFKVSCSPDFAKLFYDETIWPDGVELRDWYVKQK